MNELSLNDWAGKCHLANLKWWQDPKTGKKIERNKAEMIALMHSELSEMLEGVRKSKMDDHLPHRTNEEVELADLLIRAFDYAGAMNMDIDGAVRDKIDYNSKRFDHSFEARLAYDGKKF